MEELVVLVVVESVVLVVVVEVAVVHGKDFMIVVLALYCNNFIVKNKLNIN